MRIFLRAFLLLVSLCLSAQSGNAQTVDTSRKPGLIFSGKHSRYLGTSGNPERIKRIDQTAFSISPKDGVELGPVYGMDFDFSVWYADNFSSLFTIKNEVYELTLRYLFHPDSSNIHLQLRVNGKHLLFSFVMPKSELTEKHYYPFRLSVDETRGFIEAELNGVVKRSTSKYISVSEAPVFYFGLLASDPDCAAIILRDLRLTSAGKIKHRWKFNEVEGNTAFDSLGGVPVIIQNPLWALATYYDWTRVFRPDETLFKDVTSFYKLNTFNRSVVLEQKPGGLPVGNVFPMEADSVELESVIADTALKRIYANLVVYQKEKCLRYSYYINTPPMTDREYERIVATTPVLENEGHSRFLLILGMVVLVLVVPGMIWLIISKKQKSLPIKRAFPDDQEGKTEIVAGHANFITIFGGLKIIDSTGKDLRAELPPKAQEFLSAVLFYCAFDENNSVQVKKLDSKLWPDFTDSKGKIKNNRNVTSSKVRKILEKLGSVKMETDGERITLTVNPPVRNEVKEFANLLSLFKVKAKIEVDHLMDKFITIIRGGTPFQGLETAWAESQRFDTAGEITNLLLSRCQYLYRKNDYQNCEETSRLVDLFDPVNEQAYYYRIKSLYYLGRHALVDEVWNNFLIEYKKESGIDYPGTIKSILKD